MLLTLPFIVLGLSLVANANHFADGSHNVIRHARHARAPVSVPPAPLKKRKSCRPKTPSSAKATSTAKEVVATTKKATPTTKAAAAVKTTKAAQNNNANTDKGNNNNGNTDKGDDKPIIGNGNGALISINVPRCGPNGATSHIGKDTGPNGSLDWMNCGINSGGWSPPRITVDDIKVVDLNTAINTPGTPFKACAQYVGLFNKYANEFGLRPIMLASFAMQESSCNANTVGGGGEQGLMQLTSEKCGGAPGGNCRDPDFNIRTGSKYFADTLRNNGGDLLVSMGQYNGWYKGLTVDKATAARYSSCCRCQNNLDYLFQFLNGWCQNINAYSQGLGKYHNLDVCGN